MKLAALSERPLAPALGKEIKSCLCERPAGKEGGVSQPQETQLIIVPNLTLLNSRVQILRCVELQTALFRAQNASREQREEASQEELQAPHPQCSHGTCSSAPQAGALKEQPSPH